MKNWKQDTGSLDLEEILKEFGGGVTEKSDPAPLETPEMPELIDEIQEEPAAPVQAAEEKPAEEAAAKEVPAEEAPAEEAPAEETPAQKEAPAA